jgi:phenylpropionate dioxygenase-like ring-hydroxylating dioxygenase large terminal subunit
MLTAEENALLTQTGPETPMGSVFRSYWMPVLLAGELEADGAPQRVRLLGEDFLAFRDSEGRVGVVSPRCAHRGANLFFGRNEQCGLRCAYHGWKFDVHGQCVDVPTAEPEIAKTLKPKAAIRALKVQEYGDIIWAYLGDDTPPPLPKLEFAELPPQHRFVSKKLQQCNWAQAVEGGLDTAHFSFLHTNFKDGERVPLMPQKPGDNEPKKARYRWLVEDTTPKYNILQHASGLVFGASRKADNDQRYWRITQFMMPNHSLAPNSFPGENSQGNTWVPVNDESCWIFCFAYNIEKPFSDEDRKRMAAGQGIFATVDDNFVPIRNRNNDYLIDRNLQRNSNFTGITGIAEQDAAIVDSQGLIADRSQEMLGKTDLGVVRFRQMMLNATRDLTAGKLPHGVHAPDAYLVRSGDAMSEDGAPLTDVLEARFGDKGGTALSDV